MTVRCSICRLEPEALAAVDAALQENMPLDELVRRTGLSRSALWRHGHHAVKAEGAATPPKAVPKVKNAVPAPVEPAEPAVRTQTPAPAVPEPPIDQEASRKRALARTERLWSELDSCLEAAQKPTVVVGPGGNPIEVPIDLRTRSSVIRAGASIVDLGAKLAGVYDPPAPSLDVAVFTNVILCPKTWDPDLQPAEPPGPVIDARLERFLSDGETPPDSEK